MNTPTLDYFDFPPANDPAGLLSALSEYTQDQFFDPALQRRLVRHLQLDSPGWQALLERIRFTVGREGFVVVKNLPFDENNRLSVALASQLGSVVAHNNRVPSVVREITPRPGPAPLENFPHTDSPHWVRPNSLITLECKSEDQHLPVWSMIVPVWELEALLQAEQPELYQRLYRLKYPFLLIPDAGGGPLQVQPVLASVREGGAEHTHIRFCYADSAVCVSEHGADPAQLEDLYIVRELAAQIARRSRFEFRRGDWLVFDNLRTLHSKTETSPDSARVLKKIKLQVDRSSLYAA